MTGYLVRPKDVLETKNLNIYVVVESQFNGINIILNITLKIILLLRLSRVINSIYFILSFQTNRRLLNIIYKQLRVQTIALSNLKLALLTKTQPLKSKEDNGTSHRNLDLKVSFIKEFFNFILTSRSQSLEFDCYNLLNIYSFVKWNK